jgi:NADH-quinone oxidoreductase subunit H
MVEAIDAILIPLIKSAIIAWALMTTFAYLTLWERKFVGRLQVRYGPNRVGPFGLLQPLADGIKLLFKEDIVPMAVDRVIYTVAPMVSMITALIAFAVIPIGPDNVTILGHPVPLRIANVNAGILIYLAITSLGVYGIVLAGWASNNKYSLLGGLRSAAQMISYELALGLSLVGVLMISGTLNMQDIVTQQSEHVAGLGIPLWNVVRQPLGFVLYMIAGIAEVNRAPFDLAEADSELVAGYHTEYGTMRFALFFMAEYINMVTVSGIATTLFLGGWAGPTFGLTQLDGIFGVFWFVLKVFLLLTFMIWIRASWPRIRYDRLMRLGWVVMLPLGIFNVLATGAWMLVASS